MAIEVILNDVSEGLITEGPNHQGSCLCTLTNRSAASMILQGLEAAETSRTLAQVSFGSSRSHQGAFPQAAFGPLEKTTSHTMRQGTAAPNINNSN